MKLDPKDTKTAHLHSVMLGAVQPRPIAFASTIDEDGNVNLSPYSFFNVFSANPPIMIFSPARRVRDNSIKHTLINARATGEVVINIVNYDIVQQMSLSSTEYGADVDEFVKSGLTAVASDMIAPPRVAESPVQFECKVKEIVELGQEGGAGNLIICEVVMVHVNDEVLDEDGKIDQVKIDTVARMGGNWYCRSKDAMFEVPKPLATLGVGVDALPDHARNSTILTGNDLGKLGNIEAIPDRESVIAYAKAEKLSILDNKEKHIRAQELILEGNIIDAWKIILL
ncbi:flavin reductase family protein [Nonlabens ulvanivorans]|uniref:Flavin reductase n=1 Tax=Nonlabens ulvanivorans TaxID=906888 RepID=A0A084JTJ5_NONUL|nr:flavin reductase family protein [Nonlabens ulvanivorans]KEZ92279.1 flavin reductase [Nonlabens ulvanivorans]PRX15112.1 flavin reductase (DIM6/NTAB) family NADH-FMN oxidoreductase RutF [Nonlabens ulvanivorans]WOI22536.1 flavin reductase family protein [Nonlabens ulvanivorans]